MGLFAAQEWLVNDLSLWWSPSPHLCTTFCALGPSCILRTQLPSQGLQPAGNDRASWLSTQVQWHWRWMGMWFRLHLLGMVYSQHEIVHMIPYQVVGVPSNVDVSIVPMPYDELGYRWSLLLEHVGYVELALRWSKSLQPQRVTPSNDSAMGCGVRSKPMSADIKSWTWAQHVKNVLLGLTKFHETRKVNFFGIALQFLSTRCRDVQSDCGEVIADILASWKRIAS